MLIYGVGLAILAFLLEWLDYRHTMRSYSTEFYVICVAALFTALGIWLGNRLTARPREPGFERNQQALDYLGISSREFDVLELLAAGCSNKVIARQLDISPNTVKTHVSRVFEKLDVGSRTQAILKARTIALLP